MAAETSSSPAPGNVRIYSRPSRLAAAAPAIAVSVALLIVGTVIALISFLPNE